MQTVHEAANRALSSKPSLPTATVDSVPSKLPDSLLVNFWERMLAMFGHTWASQYGAVATGLGADTWSKALAGVKPSQLAHGLRETLASGSEFPPSAPKFRAMCLGVPSLAQVRALFAAKDKTPFMRLVWQNIDSYRYRNADSYAADRMLADAYEVARDHIMRGGQLPLEPVAEIEEQDTKPVRADPKFARPYVESLAKLLGDPEPEPEPEATP